MPLIRHTEVPDDLRHPPRVDGDTLVLEPVKNLPDRAKINLDRLRSNKHIFAVAQGTGNNIVISMNPPLTSIETGTVLIFKALADNTGPVTVKVDDLPIKQLKKDRNTDLTPRSIKQDTLYSITYNSEYFQLSSGGGVDEEWAKEHAKLTFEYQVKKLGLWSWYSSNYKSVILDGDVLSAYERTLNGTLTDMNQQLVLQLKLCCEEYLKTRDVLGYKNYKITITEAASSVSNLGYDPNKVNGINLSELTLYDLAGSRFPLIINSDKGPNIYPVEDPPFLMEATNNSANSQPTYHLMDNVIENDPNQNNYYEFSSGKLEVNIKFRDKQILSAYGLNPCGKGFDYNAYVLYEDGVYKSDDLKEWSKISNPVANGIYTDFYAELDGTVFFVSTKSSGLYKSQDCVNWTKVINTTDYVGKISKAGSNYFVTVGDKLFTSIDGNNFVACTNALGIFGKVIYNNSLYIAPEYSLGKGIVYSTDGLSWTNTNLTSVKATSVIYDNNSTKYYCCTLQNSFYYSIDGKNWRTTESSIHDFEDILECSFGDYKAYAFVTGGTSIYFSNDCIDWQSVDLGAKINRLVPMELGVPVVLTEAGVFVYDSTTKSYVGKYSGYNVTDICRTTDSYYIGTTKGLYRNSSLDFTTDLSEVNAEISCKYFYADPTSTDVYCSGVEGAFDYVTIGGVPKIFKTLGITKIYNYTYTLGTGVVTRKYTAVCGNKLLYSVNSMDFSKPTQNTQYDKITVDYIDFLESYNYVFYGTYNGSTTKYLMLMTELSFKELTLDKAPVTYSGLKVESSGKYTYLCFDQNLYYTTKDDPYSFKSYNVGSTTDINLRYVENLKKMMIVSSKFTSVISDTVNIANPKTVIYRQKGILQFTYLDNSYYDVPVFSGNVKTAVGLKGAVLLGTDLGIKIYKDGVVKSTNITSNVNKLLNYNDTVYAATDTGIYYTYSGDYWETYTWDTQPAVDIIDCGDYIYALNSTKDALIKFSGPNDFAGFIYYPQKVSVARYDMVQNSYTSFRFSYYNNKIQIDNSERRTTKTIEFPSNYTIEKVISVYNTILVYSRVITDSANAAKLNLYSDANFLAANVYSDLTPVKDTWDGVSGFFRYSDNTGEYALLVRDKKLEFIQNNVVVKTINITEPTTYSYSYYGVSDIPYFSKEAGFKGSDNLATDGTTTIRIDISLGLVSYSKDLSTWSTVTLPSGILVNASLKISYSKPYFIMEQGGKRYRSKDCVTWTSYYPVRLPLLKIDKSNAYLFYTSLGIYTSSEAKKIADELYKKTYLFSDIATSIDSGCLESSSVWHTSFVLNKELYVGTLTLDASSKNTVFNVTKYNDKQYNKIYYNKNDLSLKVLNNSSTDIWKLTGSAFGFSTSRDIVLKGISRNQLLGVGNLRVYSFDSDFSTYTEFKVESKLGIDFIDMLLVGSSILVYSDTKYYLTQDFKNFLSYMNKGSNLSYFTKTSTIFSSDYEGVYTLSGDVYKSRLDHKPTTEVVKFSKVQMVDKSGYSVFNIPSVWKFEGSNDGVEWILLDLFPLVASNTLAKGSWVYGEERIFKLVGKYNQSIIVTDEDWGLVTEVADKSEDWGLVEEVVTEHEDWNGSGTTLYYDSRLPDFAYLYHSEFGKALIGMESIDDLRELLNLTPDKDFPSMATFNKLEETVKTLTGTVSSLDSSIKQQKADSTTAVNQLRSDITTVTTGLSTDLATLNSKVSSQYTELDSRLDKGNL